MSERVRSVFLDACLWLAHRRRTPVGTRIDGQTLSAVLIARSFGSTQDHIGWSFRVTGGRVHMLERQAWAEIERRRAIARRRAL